MYEQLFQWSNWVVMPFWLVMIFLPVWRWTPRIVNSPWIAAPVALLYATLVLPRALDLFAELANPQLLQIAAFLGTPVGATIGWAHLLAFDLFVGRWVYLDSRERKFSAWLISPILFFVLMLGPIGLLLYLSVRLFATRQGA